MHSVRSQVGIIYNPLNQYRVVMELAPQWLQNPDTLKNFYITGSNGASDSALRLRLHQEHQHAIAG